MRTEEKAWKKRDWLVCSASALQQRSNGLLCPHSLVVLNKKNCVGEALSTLARTCTFKDERRSGDLHPLPFNPHTYGYIRVQRRQIYADCITPQFGTRGYIRGRPFYWLHAIFLNEMMQIISGGIGALDTFICVAVVCVPLPLVDLLTT